MLYNFFHGNELQVLKRQFADLIVMVQIGIGKLKVRGLDLVAIDSQTVTKEG
jgi:hypothetical protein